MIGDNQVEIIRKMSRPNVLAGLKNSARRFERQDGKDIRTALLSAFSLFIWGTFKNIRLTPFRFCFKQDTFRKFYGISRQVGKSVG